MAALDQANQRAAAANRERPGDKALSAEPPSPATRQFIPLAQAQKQTPSWRPGVHAIGLYKSAHDSSQPRPED